ncbi:hypothetical protein ACFL5S_00465 [Fibrobacterota bacterium]
MALSPEEKALVKEALQIYLQIVARQMPKQQLQQVFKIAENVAKKIDTLGAEKGKGNKPPGITDEWYNKVCKTCDKLSSSGCTERVTEKFPGKCDPILHYEREKQNS